MTRRLVCFEMDGVTLVRIGESAARLVAGVLAAAVIFCTSASFAQGSTTIGSDLAGTPAGSPSCAPQRCTFWQTSLPGRMTAAPVEGVIVRWRVKAGMTRAGSETLRLRVVHPQAGGKVAFRGDSDPITISDLAIKV